MSRAYYSTILDHPAATVWATIRQFDHYDWAGVGGTTTLEDGRRGDQTGAVRNVEMGDGITRRQRLLAHSDLERSYSYEICAPSYLPLTDYLATIRVVLVIDGDRALVEWWATFDCAEPARWVEIFERQNFPAWLGGLRRFMEAQPA